MFAGSLRYHRLVSAAAVLALHAALGWLLLAGFGVVLVKGTPNTLKTFTIFAPSPKPVSPPPRRVAASGGTPARQAAELPAPPPRAAPLATIPVPVPLPVVGSFSTGPGVTADGGGDAGSGGFGGGDGSGAGGGIAEPARQIGGRFRRSDYPRAARRAGAEGRSIVRFVVGIDGRASACIILRSSGHAELDATTCRVIEQRYRFRPASNARGQPVAETKVWEQIWWIERVREVHNDPAR